MNELIMNELIMNVSSHQISASIVSPKCTLLTVNCELYRKIERYPLSDLENFCVIILMIIRSINIYSQIDSQMSHSNTIYSDS
jgi:hypothetical protein